MERRVMPSSPEFKRLDEIQQRICVATNPHVHRIGMDVDMEDWQIKDAKNDLLEAMQDEMDGQNAMNLLKMADDTLGGSEGN